MKTKEYVRDHIEQFESYNVLERRFAKRFIQFLPVEDWK